MVHWRPVGGCSGDATWHFVSGCAKHANAANEHANERECLKSLTYTHMHTQGPISTLCLSWACKHVVH